MRTLPLRYALLCLLFLLPVSMVAQQYKIKNIVFLTPGPYPQADLLAIAALKPGDKLDRPGLQNAAARLMNTGYFQEVVGSLDGPVVAIDVRFDLKPVDPATLLPVSLENFIWLTPEELETFRKSVPLLSFGLPEAGDANLRVKAALEQALAAKSVTAKVAHAVIEPTTAHPFRVYSYRVSDPTIVLGTAHLQGVSAALAPQVRAVLTSSATRIYNEGLAGNLTAELLLAPYFNAGYLDAKFEGVQRSPQAGSADPVKVEVTARVVPGEPYRVGVIAFTPSSEFSAEAFAKELKLHPNDPASRRLLLGACSAATSAQRRAGYLDAFMRTDETKDPTTHVVNYALSVVPGEQYKLKSITIVKLPEALHPEVAATLKMHPGDVYQEGLVASFLLNLPADKPLAGYHGNFSASADPNTHLVDLTLEFEADHGLAQ